MIIFPKTHYKTIAKALENNGNLQTDEPKKGNEESYPAANKIVSYTKTDGIVSCVVYFDNEIINTNDFKDCNSDKKYSVLFEGGEKTAAGSDFITAVNDSSIYSKQ